MGPNRCVCMDPGYSGEFCQLKKSKKPKKAGKYQKRPKMARGAIKPRRARKLNKTTINTTKLVPREVFTTKKRFIAAAPAQTILVRVGLIRDVQTYVKGLAVFLEVTYFCTFGACQGKKGYPLAVYPRLAVNFGVLTHEGGGPPQPVYFDCGSGVGGPATVSRKILLGKVGWKRHALLAFKNSNRERRVKFSMRIVYIQVDLGDKNKLEALTALKRTYHSFDQSKKVTKPIPSFETFKAPRQEKTEFYGEKKIISSVQDPHRAQGAPRSSSYPKKSKTEKIDPGTEKTSNVPKRPSRKVIKRVFFYLTVVTVISLLSTVIILKIKLCINRRRMMEAVQNLVLERQAAQNTGDRNGHQRINHKMVDLLLGERKMGKDRGPFNETT